MIRGDRLGVMRWVGREVVIHEPSLRAWLRRVANANDIDDIVQESYCRIANLKDISHIRDGRAYLFTTARMIILERARRAKIVSIETIAEIDDMQIYCENPSPEHSALARNYFDIVDSLIGLLPERCQKIFRMRKIEGISQREVAERLGVPEHTVENDVAKGMALLLKAIADGERRAEIFLESIDRHEPKCLSTGNR